MTFGHEFLLWFLPLAAVPLLLHLLTLHRLKTVELSTFRFLFDSYVQQRRRMQFLEALLAILRTLFLLLLVFMFARPVLKQLNFLFPGSGAGGRDVILLMDSSASMNAATDGISSFQRAKDKAQEVVESLSPEDRITVVRVGVHPEELVSRYNTDTRGIKEKIANLKLSSSRANLFAALLQLFGPEASRRTNPLVYLFTDCQANTWREIKNQGLEGLIPTGTPFRVVNVGSSRAVPNVAVLGDAPRRNRVVAGFPVLLFPRVVNLSRTESAEVTLSVLIDDKEIDRAQLRLKPGEVVVRKVDYIPREPGILRGRFEITAKAPDRFPDDDRYLFTLAVQPRLRVLLINGKTAPDPVEDEARYLHIALTAKDNPEAAPKPGAAPPPEPLRYDVRDLPEAGLTPEALREASVVVLANCGALNANQFAWLRDFVAAGGGLLVFPGDKVVPATYNTQFFPVPGPQGENLTAARLGPTEGDPDKVETFEQLASLDFTHPVLSVFDHPDSDVRHFKTVRVYRRFKLSLPAQRGNANPLIRFASGDPALVESHLGDGTVLLAAFPAHTRWTNLPTKPDFTPLVIRLVGYLEHHPEVEVPATVVADTVAEIKVTTAWDPAEATVKDPAGHSHSRSFERKGTRLFGAFAETAERGYYGVEVRGGASQTKAGTFAFAVNLAPEESDFTTLEEDKIRELLPAADLTVVNATAEAQQQEKAQDTGRQIWRQLIYLLFALIGVEFLLATLSGHRAETDENTTLTERILAMSPGSWVGKMTGAAKKGAPE